MARYALLLTLLLPALPMAPATAAPLVCPPVDGVRCEDWAAREATGWGEDVLPDPEANRVYVAATALGPDGTTNGDLYLHAYEASTGEELWSLSRDGGAADYDIAIELVLLGGGSRLCLSGGITPGGGPIPGVPSGADIVLLCVDPATGGVLWERTYDTPTGRDDGADGGMVAGAVPLPDGGTRELLFLGAATGPPPLFEGSKALVTLAIDPMDGGVVWRSDYRGPGQDWVAPRGIGVSPDGRRVFVTGESTGAGTSHDYATVAYDALTGAQLWAARYSGLGGELADEPNDLAVSPTGDTIAVTGASEDAPGHFRWATVVYDAETGAQRWAVRHSGIAPPPPIEGQIRPTYSTTIDLTGIVDEARAVTYAPDGSAVYVTGWSRAFPNGTDYMTIKYSTFDGSESWSAPYDGPSHRHDGAMDVVVDPSGATVYVTGNSGAGTFLEHRYTHGPVLDDAATVAYSSDEGEQLWVARFDGGPYLDEGSAMAFADGRLYVTGMAGGIEDRGGGMIDFTDVDPVTLSYAA